MASKDKIDKLIEQGKYNEAELAIQALEEGERKLGQIDAAILKIELANNRGKYQEAFTYAKIAQEKLLTLNSEECEEITELARKLKMVDVTTLIAEAQRRMGNLDEALSSIEDGETIYQSIEETQETLPQKASYLNSKGIITFLKGQIDDAVKYFEESKELFTILGKKRHIAKISNNLGVAYWQRGKLDEALENYMVHLKMEEEMGNKRTMGISLNNIGILYQDKGDLDKALEYSEKSKQIFEELGNEQDIAMAYQNIGEIYRIRGQLDFALDQYEQSLTLYKKLKNKSDIAGIYNNLGIVYRTKGDLERAIDYFKKSLEIWEELGNDQSTSYTLNDIGLTYQEEGNIEEARKCLTRSYQIRKKLDNKLLMSETILNMINIELQAKETDKANDCLKTLQKIAQAEENKIVQQRYKLARAIILKATKDARNRGKAEILLEGIIEDKDVIHEIMVMALLAMGDLLVKEARVSGNEKILDDVEKYADQLLTVAQEQQSFSLLTETHWIMSQIALAKLNIEKARLYLTQALLTATETGLNRLAQIMSDEYDHLLTKMEEWESENEEEFTLQERLDESHLEQLISRMAKMRTAKIPKKEKERPIMVMILSKGGLPLISHKFGDDEILNDLLISGFLAAISSFVNDAFSVEGSIDRIRHQNNTILIRDHEDILFCYVYKGKSYYATKKLEKLVEKTVTNETTWNTLQYMKETGDVEIFNREKITLLIEKIITN